MRFIRHYQVESSAPIADLLAAKAKMSKASIKDCLEKGCVWVLRQGNGERRVRKGKFVVRENDRISIYYDESVLQQIPPLPTCLYNEGRYSIWDKPAMLLSQGSRFGDHCSLLRFVEKAQGGEKNAYLIHRLDREARGLLLFAHDREAAGLFSQMFQNRQVEKRYRVIAHGILAQPGEQVVLSNDLDGKSARTEIEVLSHDHLASTSELDVCIKTGRLHQIRRHLQKIGHPLVGDSRYGTKNTLCNIPLQLTAYRISFICPISHKYTSFTLAGFST